MAGAITDQLAVIRDELASRPARLIRHVERVVVEATSLARLYDVDPERVALAAWGHDLFRAAGPQELLLMAREAGLVISAADLAEPVLLHGPIAAATLQSRFAVTDAEVLAAVRDHTLGSPAMPLIARILLLADKFEPRKRKRTPVMREIRRLARRDLDAALLCWADWKWIEERDHGWQSHPAHWVSRQEWVREHHAHVLLPQRIPLEQFER